jgi:hypothetical protein
VASTTLIAPPEEPLVSGSSDHEPTYRCECGHGLRVFGGGRHRVYFEPANTRLDDPVMNGVCPECGRGLPGNRTGRGDSRAITNANQLKREDRL